MLDQAFRYFVQFQVHDLADVILVQGAEDDDAIHAVDEFRAEYPLERLGQLLAHLFVGQALLGFLVALQLEAERGLLLDLLRADVGGHDDDGVAEIHRVAARIGEVALFHDLQQHVVHFGMRLLDLVENHDGVRAAAQGFGQLAGILVANVAGRRADQPRSCMSFHELGHVELDEGILAAEHELSQGLGRFCFADAGRAKEDERANRPARVFESRPRPPHRLGDGLDRLALADDGLVQFLFHLEQTLRLCLGNLHDRHTRPHGDHLGDVVGADHRAVGAVPGGAHFFQLAGQAGFLLLPGLDFFRLSFLDGQGAAGAHLLQLAVNILGRFGRVGLIHAHARSGLVNQVNGFIRQESLRHVPGREPGRRFDGLIRDDEVVMLLVHLAHTFENVNGFVHGRLVHDDGLEATLQRGVRFDVLAVLVQRGSADALQLAARKRRFQDISRVHGGTGRAGPDQHVDFVNEQNRFGFLEFVNDALQSFLELAAVHRAGHQRTNVQFEHALVQQRRRDIALDDALRQPLDDGRLADARFADQRRVVFGAPRQYLDDALDLHLAANDRVQFAFLGQGGQVGGELVNERSLGLLFAARPNAFRHGRLAGFLEHAARLAADLVGGHAQFSQDSHPRAFEAYQAEQDVLGADVLVSHAAGFVNRKFQYLLGIGGKLDLAAPVIAFT